MKITIEVETWHEAHYLAGALVNAAWSYQGAELPHYADFFRRAARAVTKQAEPLNQKLWDERKAWGNSDNGAMEAG